MIGSWLGIQKSQKDQIEHKQIKWPSQRRTLSQFWMAGSTQDPCYKLKLKNGLVLSLVKSINHFVSSRRAFPIFPTFHSKKIFSCQGDFLSVCFRLKNSFCWKESGPILEFQSFQKCACIVRQDVILASGRCRKADKDPHLILRVHGSNDNSSAYHY